jgi:hypothetical protein
MLERYGHTRDTEIRRAVTANADRLDHAATAEKKQHGKSDPQPGEKSFTVTELTAWRPQRVPRKGAT